MGGLTAMAGGQIEAGIARSKMSEINARNAARNAELSSLKLDLQKNILHPS